MHKNVKKKNNYKNKQKKKHAKLCKQLHSMTEQEKSAARSVFSDLTKKN
jgi:hypothetical protein